MFVHGNTGKRHSRETKALLSIQKRGVKREQETIEKITASKLDKKKYWISQVEYIWL